ncbi:Probable multidrug resistance ABC transporter ATP-binding/permease protein YheI [Acholeplasma oculi]|uniref:ABC transporter, ATP-binding/permease protein n=1 Tax=Acholeplasma oculi TaxID=35623 RepID=A0A061ABV6_9MOLU|nr:ABC transporter ATP-binding protein [Acholeplasma oculi]CDR31303.1 ABC transporter, ATP-binding/permease protein [Acholeplasma oculi]SKC38882.1 ATP-binding cassette, subfamily B [Acholeplasma oculi]SUT91543.1 Probable multidrug resistance ABC transporter ATP-binding/permease protein YheI [Acholeplasma oculi]
MKFISLLKLTKGHTWGYIVLFILTIFHRFSYSYVPLFTQYLIRTLYVYIDPVNIDMNPVNFPGFVTDFFQSGQTVIEIALYVAITLIFFQAFRYLMMYFELYLRGRIQESIAKNLRVKLYDHIQNLSYKYHNNSDSGDLIQRVTSDVETTTGFIVLQLMQLVGLVASLLSGVFQMYYINQTIMWICLGVIPLYAVSSLFYFMKIEKIFDKVEKDESSMMTVIQENVSGNKVVKAFANEPYELEKMEVKNLQYTKSNIRANKVVAIYWGSMDFVSMSQYAIITILCIHYVREGIMDGASFIASLMLIGLLVWPIRGLGRLINEFTKAFVAIGRINHILDQKTEFEEDGQLEPEIKGHIIFNNVSFKFDDDHKYLLNNVTFEIKPGQTVAFIGKTGSGKSTIINILMRMYPYEGSITVDGVELKDIKKQHIRKYIGAVLQDPFLYSRSVYENISITNRNALDEEIKKAAVTAALEKDIHTFKNGYETMVGEKGTTLSGGQKQRVAIARVLVSEKPILVFDDALSAVDNKTDMMIRQALNEKTFKSTNIIITHRITTAKEADQIIVLNDGTIEAIGKHQELAHKEGLYQKLWGIQGRLEKEFLDMIKEGESHA